MQNKPIHVSRVRGKAVSSDPNALVKIIAFSPLFGFFYEGLASDHGPARKQPSLHRVKFNGETVERERFVFPELDAIGRDTFRALNELYFHRQPDLPIDLQRQGSKARRKVSIARRKINLLPRGER